MYLNITLAVLVRSRLTHSHCSWMTVTFCNSVILSCVNLIDRCMFNVIIARTDCKSISDCKEMWPSGAMHLHTKNFPGAKPQTPYYGGAHSPLLRLHPAPQGYNSKWHTDKSDWNFGEFCRPVFDFEFFGNPSLQLTDNKYRKCYKKYTYIQSKKKLHASVQRA